MFSPVNSPASAAGGPGQSFGLRDEAQLACLDRRCAFAQLLVMGAIGSKRRAEMSRR